MVQKAVERIRAFLAASLLRRIMAVTVTGLTIASLAFLLILQTMQTRFVLGEYARASIAINATLQAALENAMLKRDLPGLRRMIDDIGAQDNVAGVMILAPTGDVRFADDHALVGSRMELPAGLPASPDATPQTRFIEGPQGADILRSINPVRNKPGCTACHGSPEAHPVNGILVLDFDAAPARAYATRGALMLIGMGGVVMLLLAGALWWAVHRLVTARLEKIGEAVRAFGRGDLAARADESGEDEISGFSRAFNRMAGRLQTADTELHTALDAVESILEAAPDEIRVIGPDFRVLHANQAHLTRLGLTRDAVIGRPCFALSHGRDTPCPPTLQTCPVERILQHDAGALRFVDLFHLPDGSAMSADVIAAPVRMIVDGAPRDCVIEVIRDLDAEVEISHQQRLSEIAMLANGVAHEINTPLSSILLAVHEIRAGLPPDGDGQDLAGLVETEIRSCMDVTEGLMRLSQPGSGATMPVDMAAVANNLLRLLGPTLARAGIEARLSCADGSAMIEASDSDIRILMLNLFTNAIHAMADGGRLTITLARNDGVLSLAVADTGRGIAPEDIDKIFLPFWTKRPDGSLGRGLGLAICQQVVGRLGGRIEVRSNPGQGATFTVIFPLGEGPAA